MNTTNNKQITKRGRRIQYTHNKKQKSTRVPDSDIDVSEYVKKLKHSPNTFMNIIISECMCGGNGTFSVSKAPRLISTSQMPISMLTKIVEYWKKDGSRNGDTIENPMVSYDFSVDRRSDMKKDEEDAAKFYWWYMENFEEFKGLLPEDSPEPIRYSFDDDDITQKVAGNGFVEYITHPSLQSAIPFGCSDIKK